MKYRSVFFALCIFGSAHAIEDLPPAERVGFEERSYVYGDIRAGTLPSIGIGFRDRKQLRAHDYSCNAILPFVQLVVPSFQYTYISYKTEETTSGYTGWGIEAVFTSPTSVVPFVNYVIGKEREGLKHTQLNLNVFPAIPLVGLMIFVPESRFIAFPVVLSAVSYTIAF